MADATKALHDLVDELAADGTLDDGDLVKIRQAMEGQLDTINRHRNLTAHWEEHAHIHKSNHDPKFDKNGEQLPAKVFAGICHDCKRDLVSDVGTDRILICPKVHGNRPPKLMPEDYEAVECGEPGV